MNMQMSPTSTHSHQIKDPLVEVIGYKVETPAISNHFFETVLGSMQLEK